MLAIADVCADKLAVLRVAAEDCNLHKLTMNQTITNYRVYLSTILQTHAKFCIEDLKVEYTARSQECQPDVVLEKANAEQYTRRWDRSWASSIGPSQHQNLMTSLTEERLRWLLFSILPFFSLLTMLQTRTWRGITQELTQRKKHGHFMELQYQFTLWLPTFRTESNLIPKPPNASSNGEPNTGTSSYLYDKESA